MSCDYKKAGQYSSEVLVLEEGESLFYTHCASCHQIESNGIGPRLGGITSIIPKDSLVEFIQDPKKVINLGNERAKFQYEKYKLLMPKFNHIDTKKINAILSFIDHKTRELNIEPLSSTDEEVIEVRYAPEIKSSGLVIEVSDVASIPYSLISYSEDDPMKTRIATLRVLPVYHGLFVSDQRGIIYVIENGEVSTFLDFRSEIDEFMSYPGIGSGLGSFAFHPNYVENGLFYITHSENYLGIPADNELADSINIGLQWVLSEWKINNIKSKKFYGTKRELLRINTPTYIHGIQDIGFMPGQKPGDKNYGKLYICIGDGGATGAKYFGLSRSLNSLLGVILRINPTGNNSRNGRYGIPKDNPFEGDLDPLTREEVWAYGFRNPHRISWSTHQPVRLIATDVGQNNIEEVNIIEKGRDYGWDKVEGSFGVSIDNINNIFNLEDSEDSYSFTPPFSYYDHVEGGAISGGYVYQGPISELRDKYIFGDIVNGRMFYINIDSVLSDSAIYEIQVECKGEITSLTELSNSQRADLRISYDEINNEMYIMTKDDGMIRKITNAYINLKEVESSF